jgi:translation elongation factor EF-Tu-like GTPase
MAHAEVEIGQVSDFFRRIGVAAIKIHPGKTLKVGDQICIRGPHTYIEQSVGSLEVNHQAVDEASGGQEVGLLVTLPASEETDWPENIPRTGNAVYRISDG